MKRLSFLSPLVVLSLGALLPISSFADSGTADSVISLVVPVVTDVACTSDQETALPGTQTTTLTVLCIIEGNPNDLASGTANSFTGPTVTLTSGSNTLTANLQNAITSPDGSITSFTGTAAGFTGTLGDPSTYSNTWKLEATYTVDTTSTTPSGTYDSSPVTYTWSTI